MALRAFAFTVAPSLVFGIRLFPHTVFVFVVFLLATARVVFIAGAREQPRPNSGPVVLGRASLWLRPGERGRVLSLVAALAVLFGQVVASIDFARGHFLTQRDRVCD